MSYKVVITSETERDLEHFIKYLLEVKQNRQAAKNVLDDFELTVKKLENVAGALRYCENSKLLELGYKRINFAAHRYFLLYRVVDGVAFVDKMFHDLQDYENIIR